MDEKLIKSKGMSLKGYTLDQTTVIIVDQGF
jgi:hypothetical protein